MSRFLLGSVVFVFYLIQAQGDFEQRTVKYRASVEAELKKISDPAERAKWQVYFDLVFRQGHAHGFATGYSERIALAEGKNFLSSFECATHGLKGILEDCYQYSKFPITPRVLKRYNSQQIPIDILEVIEKNDEWVRTFSSRKKYLLFPSIWDEAIKSFEEIMATTNKPETIDKYLNSIEYSFKTWYAILKFNWKKDLAPVFIDRLLALLIEFQERNVARYKTIDEVHQRFAAQMARSYKMMCALHYQLNNIMHIYARQHTEMTFSDILFKFAPGWHMSQEQFEFLNILRHTIPNRLSSLKYIFFKNERGDWIVFPYDYSKDCGHMMMNEIPTIPMNMTTLISVYL